MKKSLLLSLIFALSILFSFNNSHANVNQFVSGAATIAGILAIKHIITQCKKIKDPNCFQIGGVSALTSTAVTVTFLGLLSAIKNQEKNHLLNFGNFLTNCIIGAGIVSPILPHTLLKNKPQDNTKDQNEKWDRQCGYLQKEMPMIFLSSSIPAKILLVLFEKFSKKS